MANQDAAKKRILVVGTDELNYVLESINRGLKNYQLEGLPSIHGSAEEIMESQLHKGYYNGFLVDELFVEFLPKVKQQRKKYGVIRWGDRYDEEMKKIMSENKTVRFGAEDPKDIEKGLDAIFS
jgi:hypothetical protein